jgi:hypothetical protein
VSEALVAGVPDPTAAERATQLRELADRIERGDDADPPTPSDSMSSTRSSGSLTLSEEALDPRHGAALNGGETSNGESSAFTSSELTAA